MSTAWPVAFALFACFTLLGQRAQAAGDELGLVVLDRSPPSPPAEAWPAAEQRTRAELLAVGLSVVEVDAPDRDPGKPGNALGRAVRERGAVAGVRLVRFKRPPSVDIWVVDEVTGKTSSRRVSTQGLPESEAIAVVALAVVELLNASLLELRAAHRARGTKTPTHAVIEMVDRSLEPPAEAYRFALRGGATVLGSPGGLGLQAGPTLGASWGFHPSFLLDADAFLSATESEVDGSAGRAHVRLGAGRLHLIFRGVDSGVQPLFGIGFGALVAWASGEPRDRYVASDDRTVVALPSALVGVAIRASSSFRARIALASGFAVPALSATLAGEPAASAGRPLLDASVGLEWTMPEAERAAP
jgi:hypothetical protein